MPSKLLRDIALNQSPVLNNIALGYENNSFVGTVLFPKIGVKSEKVLVPEWGKGHLRMYESERALRAKARVIAPDAKSSHTITLEEHNLEIVCDRREIEQAQADGDLPGFLTHQTKMVLDSHQLTREYLIADMVQTTGNMGSGHYVTLVGSDQWSHADSNPITNIETGIAKLRSKAVKANTIVFGDTAWEKFKNHADVISALFGTGARKPVTPEMIADHFSTDKVKFTVTVGSSFYESSTGVITDVWSDNCIIAHVPQNTGDMASHYTPAAGYSFWKNGNGDPIIKTRWSDDEDSYIIKAILTMKQVLLMTDAIYLINDTNA